MTYPDWARKHPQAALELQETFGALAEPGAMPDGGEGKSEAWSQQRVRFQVAHQGAFSWRNNVGATKAKEAHRCPACSYVFEVKKPPIRYGLANDSAQLNDKIKSADVILAIPRIIRPQDVGRTIAQFGSVECKRPGWTYTGKDGEPQQAAWAALINRIGGFATFSTGDIKL